MRWVLALVVLSGCAAERAMQTEFQPTRDGFRFEAQAGGLYPADSAAGEELRMRWLGELLAQNNMCPNGFQIDSRQVVNVYRDTIHRVYYEGRCA